MHVVVSYLTKDRLELTKQTFPVLRDGQHALFWIDGSTDPEALSYFEEHRELSTESRPNVKGGADAAIVYALTMMLEHPAKYAVVGLCESDVFLQSDWFWPTLELFEKGKADGLNVGAVSPRCYADRILIQRDDHAIMHNLGAGIILLTREAAQLILANYRTGWWRDTRAIFAQLSGIDIGRYAAFRGNEQWTTTDWHWDAVLAQHGLASLALTPSPVDMIGQEPSLEEQGLTLAREPVEERRDDKAFHRFAGSLDAIRDGVWKPTTINPVFSHQGIETRFVHQLTGRIANEFQDWKLQWSQGFGPFAYRAGEQGARWAEMILGPVTFLVSGGAKGAKVSITDAESGYEITPDIPAGEMNIAGLQVPGGMSYREIVMMCSEGAVFYGVQTTEPQPVTNHKFDYHSLPPV